MQYNENIELLALRRLFFQGAKNSRFGLFYGKKCDKAKIIWKARRRFSIKIQVVFELKKYVKKCK